MRKLLVLGAGGMAGHMVYTFLKERTDYKVFGTVYHVRFNDDMVNLNVTNSEEVKKVIGEIRPDYVINCIGILIRGSKQNPAQAIYINAYFPHLLADICKENDSRLIHISTDCVFSGEKGGYTEYSIKDARDLYGASKSLGEVIDNRNLTIRTSIIGPELKTDGEGLFDWFMNQEGEVFGYKNAIWSGVTTLELSKFINWFILHNNTYDISGLFHLTNNVEISKFELLKLIAEVFDKKIKILSSEDHKINKSFINSNSAIDYKVPSYEEILMELREFMNGRKVYSKYSV